MDFQINTYWNVETLHLVLNTIAAMMGSGDYTALLRMGMLIGLLIVLFMMALTNKQLEAARWLIQTLLIVSLLNLPIARVTITDVTNIEPPKTVANVPWMVALVAQIGTSISTWGVRHYENMVLVPDELGLKQGDLAFGHRVLEHVNKATIADPILRSDLMQYFKECTLYDVQDGAINARDIVGGTNTFALVLTPSNTNPARLVTLCGFSGSPRTVNCREAASDLNSRVNAATQAAVRFYGRQLFSRASSDAVAEQMFINATGQANSWLLNTSANASDSMKQAMFNNVWRDAGRELPVMLNDPARAAQMSSLSAAGQSAYTTAVSQNTVAMLARETLPHIRNWVEAILIAIFPLVIFIIIISPASAAGKIIFGYCMSFLWIALWPIMFAIVNSFSLLLLKRDFAALNLANTQGVPFQLTDAFSATITDELAFVGWMVVLVPFLAGAVVKLGQMGLMSIGDKMMGSFSAGASSAAGALAAGNVSMGSSRLDSQSANTASMGAYNAQASVSSGGFMLNGADGTTTSWTPNGSMYQQMPTHTAHRSIDANAGQTTATSQMGSTAVSTSRDQSTGMGQSTAYTQAQGRSSEQTSGSHQSTSTTRSQGTTGQIGQRAEFATNINNQTEQGRQQQQGVSAHQFAGFSLNAGAAGGHGEASPNAPTGAPNTGNQPAQRNVGVATTRKSKPGVSGGVQAQATYGTSATATDSQSRSTTAATTAGSSRDFGVSQTAGYEQSDGVSQQSSQSSTTRQDQALQRSQTTDSQDRATLASTAGFTQQRSNEQSVSMNRGANYMNDPKFMNEAMKHAVQHNPDYQGMSWQRLMLNSSPDQQQQIAQDYLHYQQLQQQAEQQLPASSAPTTPAVVSSVHTGNLADLSTGNPTAAFQQGAAAISAPTVIRPDMQQPATLRSAAAAVDQAANVDTPKSVAARQQGFSGSINDATATPLAQVKVMQQADQLFVDSAKDSAQQAIAAVQDKAAETIAPILAPPPNSARAALSRSLSAAADAAEKKNREWEQRQNAKD